jgi:hypothetical protein
VGDLFVFACTIARILLGRIRVERSQFNTILVFIVASARPGIR